MADDNFVHIQVKIVQYRRSEKTRFLWFDILTSLSLSIIKLIALLYIHKKYYIYYNKLFNSSIQNTFLFTSNFILLPMTPIPGNISDWFERSGFITCVWKFRWKYCCCCWWWRWFVELFCGNFCCLLYVKELKFSVVLFVGIDVCVIGFVPGMIIEFHHLNALWIICCSIEIKV